MLRPLRECLFNSLDENESKSKNIYVNTGNDSWAEGILVLTFCELLYIIPYNPTFNFKVQYNMYSRYQIIPLSQAQVLSSITIYIYR